MNFTGDLKGTVKVILNTPRVPVADLSFLKNCNSIASQTVLYKRRNRTLTEHLGRSRRATHWGTAIITTALTTLEATESGTAKQIVQ